MPDAPLALENVSKSFGGRPAVRDLSFTVNQGAILGFLGPNGAGKSTSLRIALGIVRPDAGSVRLFGSAPNIQSLRRVGFLPEERGLYRRMTARATIAYFARLKGLPDAEAERRADDLLLRHGLAEAAGKRISKLSKGMAQKVQILSAVAHNPDLIVLDEPFSGLDPVNQQSLEQLIRQAHADGATIIFSTHVMEHAERLCDRLVMIAGGAKRFEGSVAEALALAPRRALVTLANGFDFGSAMAARGFSAIQGEAGPAGQGWRVDLPPGRDAQDALRAAIDAGAPLTAFAPGEVRLRDVFVSIVGDAVEASGAEGVMKEQGK